MQDLLTDLDIKIPVMASKLKRWKACAIDYIIYSVFVFFIIYIFGNKVIDDDGETVRQLTGVPAFFGGVVPWLLYFPGIESFNNGQTLGKAMLKVRTLKEDGSRVNFGTSFIRHLFDMIDYFPFLGIIGLIVAGNNNKTQRVGDLVAKTIVVEARG